MRRLLGLVVVLAVLVGVAELLAPAWVAAQAEQAVAAETADRVQVDVEVSGPPLLLPVATSGTVDRWRMHVTQVAGREVPVEVVIDLEDVELDRGRLLRGDVVVRSVDTARATIRFDLSGSVPPALQGMADRLAEVGMGPLFDALGGDQVGGADDQLVLGELSVPLVPGSCQLASQDLVVTADCELREVPGFLLAAFD